MVVKYELDSRKKINKVYVKKFQYTRAQQSSTIWENITLSSFLTIFIGELDLSIIPVSQELTGYRSKQKTQL